MKSLHPHTVIDSRNLEFAGGMIKEKLLEVISGICLMNWMPGINRKSLNFFNVISDDFSAKNEAPSGFKHENYIFRLTHETAR
jgi:hypothetical protein